MAAVLSPGVFDDVRVRVFTEQMARHAIDTYDERSRSFEPGTNAFSIGEIEASIASIEKYVEDQKPPQGLAQLDLYDANQRYQKMRSQEEISLVGLRHIRARMVERLRRFLVETEAAIVFGQTASTTFDRVREYVDGQLALISPQGLAQFKAAYERAETSDPEAWSHALTSCRRILKSVADSLYPATGEEVADDDDVVRVMSDDKYRNRLSQWIRKHVEHEAGRKLLRATGDELMGRLGPLDTLASKAVHSDVTRNEVDQCVLQTYLFVGDLLRVRDASAARAEE